MGHIAKTPGALKKSGIPPMKLREQA